MNKKNGIEGKSERNAIDEQAKYFSDLVVNCDVPSM